jgi:3-oxoacyl-[acyl-carrier-protein] synthase-3
VPYYGQTLNRCVNLMAAIDQAVALVARGRHRAILCVTTDQVAEEGPEMANYALFSDAAASCLITAERPALDGYRVLGCDSAQQTAALDWTNEISSDLSRVLNDRLLTPHGLKLVDVKGLMHLNIFVPLVAMKERQAGFSAEQIFLDNIPKYGHCFSADPLINLVDRDALGHVSPEGLYMLAASVPGSRAGVLLQRLADGGTAGGEAR